MPHNAVHRYPSSPHRSALNHLSDTLTDHVLSWVRNRHAEQLTLATEESIRQRCLYSTNRAIQTSRDPYSLRIAKLHHYVSRFCQTKEAHPIRGTREGPWIRAIGSRRFRRDGSDGCFGKRDPRVMDRWAEIWDGLGSWKRMGDLIDSRKVSISKLVTIG